MSGGRRRGLGKTFVGRGGVRVGAVRGWYGLWIGGVVEVTGFVGVEDGWYGWYSWGRGG